VTIQSYLLEKGDSPCTINKIGRHLQGAFSRLVEDEILDKNPFRRFTRMAEPPNDKRYLSREELKRFLAVTSKVNSPNARLAQILALTGRRLTEILHLRRDEIDLEGNLMLVANNKHRQRRKQWVPIPRDVTFALDGESYTISVRGHLEWFLENNPRDNALEVCHRDTLTHWIKRWLTEIGRGDLHAHDLRHTYITLAGETTELWKIQRLVDHSSIKVTEGYFHKKAEHAEGIDLGLNEDDSPRNAAH